MNKFKYVSNAALPVVVFFLFVFSPNLAIALFSSTNEALGQSLCFLVLAMVLSILPIIVLKKRRHFFLAYAPFVLIAPVYIWYSVYFGGAPNEGILDAILHTNIGEAKEVLAANGGLSLVPVVWFACYACYVLRSRDLQKDIPPKIRKIAAGIVIVYLLALISSIEFVSTNLSRNRQVSVSIDEWKLSTHTIADNDMVSESFPFGLIATMTDGTKQLNPGKAVDFKFHTYKKNPLAGKEIYVLIIGETSRYQNWGVNGYARNTSPNLDKLFHNGELLSFSDVAAEANSTSKAVRMLISRATPSTFATSEQEGTITSAFQEAGFKTAWISSQDFLRPARGADFSSFDIGLKRRDENLLPVVYSMLAQGGQKIFMVIHTKGSHFDYDQRYASRFKVFTPTLSDLGTPFVPVYKGVGASATSSTRQAAVNSYDNAILATDDFISKVIAMVESKRAISSVFYIADHGENLFDDDRQMFMHVTPHPSQVETHIPAFIWTSTSYKARYPQKQKMLAAHTESHLSQANVFHTLLDIADIGLPSEDLTKSFASKNFVQPSSRAVMSPNWHILKYEDL